jgi:SAM-dependent methyltransferase
MLLRGPYFPSPEENRMKHVGDVTAAREFFFEKRPNNLRYLLRKRYEWMNRLIPEKGRVVELGSGAGFAREFIRSGCLLLTDVSPYPWMDLQVDALDPPFADQSLDVVICSHMVHHLANPIVFLERIRAALKPGGYLLLQELNTSFLMRLLLRLKRHEGWSYDVDVFDAASVANDPRDPWSANCSVPELLFRDSATFERHLPGYRVVENRLNECFLFPLSGGVIAKSPTIPLPTLVLRCIDLLDGALVRILPSLFALGRSVVLQRMLE